MHYNSLTVEIKVKFQKNIKICKYNAAKFVSF